MTPQAFHFARDWASRPHSDSPRFLFLASSFDQPISFARIALSEDANTYRLFFFLLSSFE